LKKKKRYEEISVQLARELRNHPPHTPACSQTGICERFKVSDGTAKKVMAELRVNGVIYSRVGRGSFTTGQRRRSTILIVSNWISTSHALNTVATNFVGGAQILCSRECQEYTIQALNSSELPTLASEIKSVYPGLRGVIFVRQPEMFYKYSRQLEIQGIETAFYGSSAYFSAREKCNYLIYDEYQVAKNAVAGLYEAGCRNIGCTYASHFEVFKARYDGYRKALHKYGLRFNNKYTLDCTSIPDCENFGTALWSSRRAAREYFLQLDGLFCHVDRIAFNVLNSAQDAGFKVPEDLRVVGVDNQPGGELFKPSLSSVDINVSKDAQAIVKLLVKCIEEGKKFQQITLTPLISRESCNVSLTQK
jgi:DNA-binding LacI/PurR family transcriptional regulator